MLICTYRRLIHGSYRWYTTEIVPDADYSEQNQVVMLYERDVHDVYGKGLDLEKMSIQNDRRLSKESALLNLSMSSSQITSLTAFSI